MTDFARLALPAALLLACACASTDPSTEVTGLIAHGQYLEALERADQYAKDRPGDSRAQQLHREASAAYLLESGRRATFEDQDELALEHFEQAAELLPDEALVQSWVEKTRLKLTDRWLDTASDFVAAEALEDALEAYSRASAYCPDDWRAKEGQARVLLQMNHRAGMGETYYNQGVRALREYWLTQARASFGYTTKYAPENERNSERRALVEDLLAEDRIALAQSLEQQQRYNASRNEYRLALLLAPENQVAKEGEQRMRVESQALELLSESDMLARRGDFEAALQRLAQGKALTKLMSTDFEAAEQSMLERHYLGLYEHAYTLESDYRFEEAVVAYTALLKEAGYYRDCIARKQTLLDFIAKADELYQRAAAEPDSARRLSLYQQIDTFWPEYKDVPARLVELRASP